MELRWRMGGEERHRFRYRKNDIGLLLSFSGVLPILLPPSLFFFIFVHSPTGPRANLHKLYEKLIKSNRNFTKIRGNEG